MADLAKGTIQQYLASVRRFEEFLGMDLAEADQEAIRRWVDHSGPSLSARSG
jgi:transposase-like protein